MKTVELLLRALLPVGIVATLALAAVFNPPASAQSTEASAEAEQATVLTEDELEVLVARIALYPDDLIAVIVAASLEPLQIVQAERFLGNKASKPDLEPDPKWDGSIVSLLNYPEIVKMMNDDLDWVEELGHAVTNQEQDVLSAIQQLREQAVASGVLKSNDKVVVEPAGSAVVVKSKDPEVVYVPTYDPQILTDPGYAISNVAEPIYYSDPYPSYYYPTAGYWAGAVTGAVWASAVDWDDRHFWGGDVDVGDIDIDINNVDINRIRNDFRDGKYKDSFNRDSFKTRLESSDRNRVDKKGREVRKQSASANRPQERRDVRKSVESGLKTQQHQGGDKARQGDRKPVQAGDRKPAQAVDRKPADRRTGEAAAQRQDRPAASQAKRPQQVAKQKGQSKPGNRVDNRPRNVSAMGDYGRGHNAKQHANRGHASRGGMQRPSGGGGHRGGRRR